MTEQQQAPVPAPPRVFAAIHSVLADIAKTGVGKNATNAQQNFKYRANEDVMDALAPLLAKHSLIILPSVIEHVQTERATRSGGVMLHTLLKCTYDFICPLDASIRVVGPLWGEAMDSGDKSTNKSLTIAYKYLCSQAFCIPFQGDDPDAQSHEIAGAPSQRSHPGPEPESPSDAPPSRSTASPGMHPERRRPGGMFTYGKKHANTPWNVVPTDYLEWALNAERTPTDVRQLICDELSWRDYELARMHAQDEKTRAERERPLEDEIP